MERIIRLVTDPTVKVRRISREVNFLSSQWTLERRGKFLEKLPLWRSIETARDSSLEAHCNLSG